MQETPASETNVEQDAGYSGTGPPPRPTGPAWEGEPRQPFDPRQKSPRMAAVLSLVPGLGQVYLGYYVRGFVIAASTLMALLFADNAPGSMEPVPGFAVFFLWLFNVIDAGRMAALYNHAVAGSRAIELPEDFKMPSMGGSIGGGAILIVFGLIALSHTLMGFSLEWIDSWWPIFPMALGAYLLTRGIMDHNASRARGLSAGS